MFVREKERRFDTLKRFAISSWPEKFISDKEELERTRNVNERNVRHFMANCDFLEFARKIVNF